METSPRNPELKVIIVLLAVLIGFMATQAYKSYQTPLQIKYEYMLGMEPDATIQQTINRLGAEGWELVFARRASVGEINLISNANPEFRYEMIFRRPLPGYSRP